MSVINLTNNTVPTEQRIEKRRWKTEEILENIEVRRRCKTVNQERYRQLNNEIKRDCSVTKERWLNKKCAHVDNWKEEVQENCLI